jgi:hypothetical protein
LDGWPSKVLQQDLFVGKFGPAAISATWFYLLVLRRFRWLVSNASRTLLTGAYDLYTAIQAELATCLEFLAATEKPNLLFARTMLQSIMDGSRSTLSKSDVMMLRLMRGSLQRCRHGKEASLSDGTCWDCLMLHRNIRGSIGGIGGEDEPLAQIPLRTLTPVSRGSSGTTLSLSGSSRDLGSLLLRPRMPLKSALRKSLVGPSKQPRSANSGPVSFRNAVDVFETYSIEDYPSRSISFEEDDFEDSEKKTEARLASEDTSLALGEMLRQRGLGVSHVMPDLRGHWDMPTKAQT